MLACMDTVLDATLVGASSNSYVVSLDEAESIVRTLRAMRFLGVDTSGWDNPGSPASDIKIQSLIMGADRVDSANLIGERQTSDQARECPRVNTGVTRYEKVIPDQMKMAQVAEACALLAPMPQEQQLLNKNVKLFTIAKKTVEFATPGESNRGSQKMSSAAYEIMKGAGLLMGGVASVYTPRG